MTETAETTEPETTPVKVQVLLVRQFQFNCGAKPGSGDLFKCNEYRYWVEKSEAVGLGWLVTCTQIDHATFDMLLESITPRGGSRVVWDGLVSAVGA